MSAAPFTEAKALVIGGSNGIGRAIVQRLAADGADVAFTWFRDRTGAATLERELREAGTTAVAIRASLTRDGAVGVVATEAAMRIGPLTHVVCSAALGRVGGMLAATDREWGAVIDANVKAFSSLVHAAHDGGCLQSAVAISSAGATNVLPHYGVVGVSKAALEAVVRYAAFEVAPHANVNAIRPGPVDTKSFRRMSSDPERTLASIAAQNPMQRVLSVDDVAAVATFLLSDDARMLTGQTIVLDGGGSLPALRPPVPGPEVHA